MKWSSPEIPASWTTSRSRPPARKGFRPTATGWRTNGNSSISAASPATERSTSTPTAFPTRKNISTAQTRKPATPIPTASPTSGKSRTASPPPIPPTPRSIPTATASRTRRNSRRAATPISANPIRRSGCLDSLPNTGARRQISRLCPTMGLSCRRMFRFPLSSTIPPFRGCMKELLRATVSRPVIQVSYA